MANVPRTFISFDFDNNSGHKLLFAGQAKNSKTPFSILDWSSKEALPQAQWEALISQKISKCEIMIILVGKSTWYATGVQKEIQFANKHGVPYFGVYVDGADSNTYLPTGLSRGNVVNWNWESIANSIDSICGGN